ARGARLSLAVVSPAEEVGAAPRARVGLADRDLLDAGEREGARLLARRRRSVADLALRVVPPARRRAAARARALVVAARADVDDAVEAFDETQREVPLPRARVRPTGRRHLVHARLAVDDPERRVRREVVER